MRASKLFIFASICSVVISQECGRPPQFHNAAGLVLGGVTSEKNKFPFLAILSNIQTHRYFCGGTLISTHHILSAAHCFQPKLVPVKLAANKVVAYLGKYDLTARNERFIYPAYPSDIIIHDDWNPNDPVYDADIAMLYIQEPITFRSNIYPACIFATSSANDGNSAIMVGYGMSEGQQIGQHQTIPREAPIAFVSIEECGKNMELRTLISRRTICGGGHGQASPCRGDSGYGLFIKQNDRWFVRALVSSSLVRNNQSCDTDNYAVFTDVIKFKSWIYKIMGFIKKLNCQFIENDLYYICNAQSMKIDSADTLISEIVGSHLSDRSNNDVTGFTFKDQNTLYLPIEVNSLFPNLFGYGAESSHVKVVRSANFVGLRKLTFLNLGANDIEELPRDVFYDLPRLKKLQISNNRIKVLNRDLFINNKNLEIIFAYGNQIESLDNGLFRANSNLAQLHINNNKIRKIGNQFFDSIPFLEIANFGNNICVNVFYPRKDTYDKLKAFVRRNCAA